MKILRSIVVHDLFAIESKILFLMLMIESNLDFSAQINQGPEWNVDLSIPIQPPYGHFANFWI